MIMDDITFRFVGDTPSAKLMECIRELRNYRDCNNYEMTIHDPGMNRYHVKDTDIDRFISRAIRCFLEHDVVSLWVVAGWAIRDEYGQVEEYDDVFNYEHENDGDDDGRIYIILEE